MKIPKYIEKLLERRARAASTFIETDLAIAGWLEKNDILVDSDDILMGACSLGEPYASIDHIRDAILNHELSI